MEDDATKIARFRRKTLMKQRSDNKHTSNSGLFTLITSYKFFHFFFNSQKCIVILSTYLI